MEYRKIRAEVEKEFHMNIDKGNKKEKKRKKYTYS